jgi:Tfp pilus assembly protein PilO
VNANLRKNLPKIFVLMLAILPVLAWAMLLRPIQACKAQMTQQISEIRAKLKAAPQANLAIEKLNRESDELAKANEALLARLPAEADLDKILQETWQLADADNLVTKSIRAVARTKAPGPAKIEGQAGTGGADGDAGVVCGEQAILMQVDGSFESFYKFMTDVETGRRIMRIQKVDIVPSDGTPHTRIEASMVIAVPYQRASAGPIAGGAS